jgi:hypothetical protein
MTFKFIGLSALTLFVLMVCTTPLSAQRVELYPNAGFFWPQHNLDNGNGLKSEGVYGLKGGVFLDQNTQVEGSFGYINHFNEKASIPTLGNGSSSIIGSARTSRLGVVD